SNFDFQGLEIKVLDGTASSQASRPDWPQPMPFVSNSAPQSDSGMSGTTATSSMIDRLLISAEISKHRSPTDAPRSGVRQGETAFRRSQSCSKKFTFYCISL
ncbi:MAG: hypothetical protein RR014_05960, partial [Bilophila sp.]